MNRDGDIRGALCILTVILLIAGCSTIESSERRDFDDSVVIDNPDLELADYLRRVPGIQITLVQGENVVMVRGASSVYGQNYPLFIIDGSPRGNNFSYIENSLSVNDIDSIRVLRGSEAMQQYGMSASAGAVLIRTKRN